MKEINRYECMSPINYRYRDEDIINRSRKYLGEVSEDKIKGMILNVAVPDLRELSDLILDLSKEHIQTICPKRIDGKIVGETTFGEVLKGYASRVANRANKLNASAQEISTNNDAVFDAAWSVVMAYTVSRNIANDIRHLYRTELGEVYHIPDYDEVGSSTMPHKVNPKDFENVCSQEKIAIPFITTTLLNASPEHQGDSTNADFLDYFREKIYMLAYQTMRLRKAMETLYIDKEKMRSNIETYLHDGEKPK